MSLARFLAYKNLRGCSVLLIFFIILNTQSITDDANALPLPLYKLELSQKPHIIYNYTLNGTRRNLLESSSRNPLFQGMGTHYSFIWVGSPPQRVSVIMDTGSHHTAFPCVGCKCGKHMDPHFDPSKSSTSLVRQCGGKGIKCFFRQSYSEGSSWHAFKVADQVYIGGDKIEDIDHARNYSIPFEFGCQDSETGLFRTQNVDGIMGLSASDETLPFQLHNKQITTSKMFALCFRIGGGVLTLGGADPSLHRIKSDDKQSIIDTKVIYAKLIKKRGWFTVKLLDILMIAPKNNNEMNSIGGAIFKCNAGKGTIVDSGTTDTYLPNALFQNFVALYKKITGLQYKNELITLSPEKLASMPIIVYRLEALEADSPPIEIRVPPVSYLEKHTNNRFVPRIYLTEPNGAVLGANFMNGHNIIFDVDNSRIGFARSHCQYEVEDTLPSKMSAVAVEKKKGSANSNGIFGYFDRGSKAAVLTTNAVGS